MGVEKIQRAADGFLVDHRVGVEQQDILRLRLADGLVVGTGKTHILAVGHEMHLRIARLQGLHGAVAGAVVNHEHLAVDTFEGFTDALQALIQQAADIVADDDYCDFLCVHAKGMQMNKTMAI